MTEFETGGKAGGLFLQLSNVAWGGRQIGDLALCVSPNPS